MTLTCVYKSCQGHVKSSTIALHSTLNISETEIEAWFQRTTNRKWYIKWSRDRWRHVTPKGAVR